MAKSVTLWAISAFIMSALPSAAQQKEDIQFLSPPLIRSIYTADPSAHVFNGRIYIYPSHDIDAGTPENDNGDHFAMRDFHVLSMEDINSPVTDHDVALDIDDIPWAGRQLWAPDVAFKDGTYFLYFPVKDKKDVFRIGVATSKILKVHSNPIRNPSREVIV